MARRERNILNVILLINHVSQSNFKEQEVKSQFSMENILFISLKSGTDNASESGKKHPNKIRKVSSNVIWALI